MDCFVTAFLAMTKCQRVHCNDEVGYAFPAMMLQAAMGIVIASGARQSQLVKAAYIKLVKTCDHFLCIGDDCILVLLCLAFYIERHHRIVK